MMYPLVWLFGDTYFSVIHHLFQSLTRFMDRYLVIFHDHFIGQLGGTAIFFVENAEDRDAIQQSKHLGNWSVQIYPLIFAYNPAAFDEQTAYTLRRYRDVEWDVIRLEKRPAYGDPNLEAQTGQEHET